MSERGREVSAEEVDLRDRHSKKIKSGEEEAMDVAMNSQGAVPETPSGACQVMSFRDKLLFGRTKRMGLEAVDVEATMLIGDEEPITVSFKGEVPEVQISERTLERLRKPFQRCLILKLLGCSIGYIMLKDRLRKLWSISVDAYDITDLSNGYFMVKFDEEADYKFALEEGPWMILGHYLTVRPWRPSFRPSGDTIHSTLVWVQLPGCPLEFYDAEVLMVAGEILGRTIKIDPITLAKKRGSYARFCVQVDLDKPLLPKIVLCGIEQEVRWEGLNMIFFSCGRNGHRKDVCPYVARPPPHVDAAQVKGMVVGDGQLPAGQQGGEKVNKDNFVFGPWMEATRK